MARRNQQRGQVVFLFALLMIPIALMIAFVFNTGAKTAAKVQVQNAADAAALSQATWTARSLNVMSANNVAITQLIAVDVVVVAYAPGLYDILFRWLGPKTKRTLQEARAACAVCNNPITCIPCFGYIAVLVELWMIYSDSQPFRELATRNQVLRSLENTFQRHAYAYSDMNKFVREDFFSFTSNVQKELAALNEVTDPPRLMLLGWPTDERQEAVHSATSLPVIRAHFPDSVQAGVAASVYRVWATGQHGTARNWSDPVYARNFYARRPPSSKYLRGAGPYVEAHNDARRPLARVFRMARRHGWRPLVSDWDEPKYKRCWEQASRSETLLVIAPTTCYPHAASLPLRGVSIYEYGPPYRSIRIGANNVDILAVTRKSEEPGLVAPSRFTSVPDSVFGLSRARVYNAVASDLYTQDWRASLVPVRGDDQTLQALRHMTRGMPPLESLYSRMDARDLESLTTR